MWPATEWSIIWVLIIFYILITDISPSLIREKKYRPTALRSTNCGLILIQPTPDLFLIHLHHAIQRFALYQTHIFPFPSSLLYPLRLLVLTLFSEQLKNELSWNFMLK